MRIVYLRTTNNMLIDRIKGGKYEVPLIPYRDPVEENEAATNTYLDDFIEKELPDKEHNFVIDDLDILPIEGPELTHTEDGLFLKPILTEPETRMIAGEYNDKGRITKGLPVNSDLLTDDTAISWAKVNSTPTTIEGYNITNLGVQSKTACVDGGITISKTDKTLNTPAPFSEALNIFDQSGLVLELGVLLLVPNNSTRDKSRLIETDGSTITRDKYPDLVTAIAGESATSAVLPDTTKIVANIYRDSGYSVTGYIVALPFK